LCDALLAFVIWRSLVAAAANPGWLLAYLWSPLVALEVARHGHLDVAGALLAASAALAFARGRAMAGTVAFALSVAVKPLPIVLLPLFARRVSLRHAAAGVAVLVALYLPFWDRHQLPLGSLPDVVDRFRFNGPIFSGVARLAGAPVAAAFAVAAGLSVAVWARRRFELASPQAWAWPMAAALLCAPLVYPWYLVWIAPFLVVPETLPLIAWTVSILSTYVVWQSAGVAWAMPAWALVLELAPPLGALFWLWRRAQKRSSAALRPSSGPLPSGP
jgi:hypothetical protein